MIYLDNAATTLKKPEGVTEAVIKALNSAGNSGRGTHEISLSASRIIFEGRAKLASFFGMEKANQIAFTSNSTEALNTAICGIVKENSHVITTTLEHNSVLRPLYALQKEKNIELSFVHANKQGCIDYADFQKLIKKNTCAIITTHASNVTGNMLDIKEIANIAHKNGLIYILDASQTAGSFPINMKETDIDVLCFTGHKSLMGPQGTGGLCVKEGIYIKPFKTGGSGIQSYSKTQPDQMPARLEAGTLNTHGIAGLSAALDFIQNTTVEQIHKKEMLLTEKLYKGLKNIEGIKIYGDFSMFNTPSSIALNSQMHTESNPHLKSVSSDNNNQKSLNHYPEEIHKAPIISFNIKGIESGIVSDTLAYNFDIASRPGAHCAPLMHESLGTVKQGAVRFSISYYNTEEEIDTAIEAVKTLAKEF